MLRAGLRGAKLRELRAKHQQEGRDFAGFCRSLPAAEIKIQTRRRFCR